MHVQHTHSRPENRRPRPAKNTENFTPSYDPPQMRVMLDTGLHHSGLIGRISTRDVILKGGAFTGPEWSSTIYADLCAEILSCGIPEGHVLKLWHGDSHLIADDHTGWKARCPTFTQIVDKIRDFYGMDIKATRFNWYRELDEWKPYHHDAAAVKPDKARTQNFTVGVSFGDTRDIAFEDAETKKVVSFPLDDGTMYAFTRDINILWKHGVPQLKPDERMGKKGRISIIAWGWLDQMELGPPAKLIRNQSYT